MNNNTEKIRSTKYDILLEIARRHLFVGTLEEQKSDRLDFHNVSVMGIKKALEEAYKAGVDSVRKGKV